VDRYKISAPQFSFCSVDSWSLKILTKTKTLRPKNYFAWITTIIRKISPIPPPSLPDTTELKIKAKSGGYIIRQ
jgi:hypothetical protein